MQKLMQKSHLVTPATQGYSKNYFVETDLVDFYQALKIARK